MVRELFGMRFAAVVRGTAAIRRRSKTTRLHVEACEPRRVLSAAALAPVAPAVALASEVIAADVWTLAEGDHGEEGHAGDIVGAVVDGRLVTDHRAYGYEFEPDTTYFDVGFDVAGLPVDGVLEMEVLQGVTFWNGVGDTPRFAPARRGVELNFNNAAENVRVGATRNVGQLIEVGVAAAGEGEGTEVHDHFDVTVGSGGAGESFARVAPLAFVFNVGASEEAHEAAVAFFDETPPVSVFSTETSLAGRYKAGDVLEIVATFSDDVTVRGTPRVPLTINGQRRFATYDPQSSGGAEAVFAYTLRRGDNGVVQATGPIQTPGRRTTIIGAAGGKVFADATILFPDAVVAVTRPPRVAAVADQTGEGTYGAGQIIQFVVTMSEDVVVDTAGGVPTVAVRALRGGPLGNAEYAGEDPEHSRGLLFRYTIAAGDSAPRGLLLRGGVLANGATIADDVGNEAVLGFRPQRVPRVRVVTGG
jgi:hypothetical protein